MHGGPLVALMLYCSTYKEVFSISLPLMNKPFLSYPVSRLEEREAELKKEYNALHQRHTEVRK